MVTVVVAGSREDAGTLLDSLRVRCFQVFVWIMLIVKLQATDSVPNILREE